MKLTVGAVALAAVISHLCGAANAASSVASVKDCDGALVVSTYNDIASKVFDWRMAENIDQETYDKAKSDLGVNATLYGVPVGGSYSDFKESVKKWKRDRTESLTKEEFRNISWKGLEKNAVTAYSACLEGVAKAMNVPILLVPDKATDSEVSFRIVYSPKGSSMPTTARLKWSGSAAKTARDLPKTVTNGDEGFSIARPKDGSAILIVNSKVAGKSDSVVITAPPKPLPDNGLEASCEIVETSDPLPSISGGDSVTWACPFPIQAGNYRTIVNIKPTSSAPLRVGYSVYANVYDGSSMHQAQLANGQIDIAASAGLPDVFASNGAVVSLPAGKAVFELRIAYSTHHCCFDKPGHDKDGPFTIPKIVSLKLEKL